MLSATWGMKIELTPNSRKQCKLERDRISQCDPDWPQTQLSLNLLSTAITIAWQYGQPLLIFSFELWKSSCLCLPDPHPVGLLSSSLDLKACSSILCFKGSCKIGLYLQIHKIDFCIPILYSLALQDLLILSRVLFCGFCMCVQIRVVGNVFSPCTMWI